MTVTNYTQNMDRWYRWTEGGVVHKALLVGGAYSVDPDHKFVADVTDEIAVSGYSRPTLASKTRTPDLTSNWIVYDCADPSFGTLAAGDDVAGWIIFEVVTNDADSLILQHISLGSIATAGLPFPVAVSASGLHRMSAV